MSGAESKDHKLFLDQSKFGEYKEEGPRSQSRINEKYDYTRKKWVVSVINVTRSRLVGHSAIVVEGWDGEKEFIGRYDIQASRKEANSFSNQRTINKIRCFENEQNKKDYKKEKYPARSFFRTKEQCLTMIESIKADELRTEQAMENVARIERNAKREKGQLSGEPESLFLDTEGKPIEPFKYQKLGKNHILVKLFGNPGAGDNCAGYCLDALAKAGIGDGSGKPKPAWIAGQCAVM